jgi:hypothetical protein
VWSDNTKPAVSRCKRLYAATAHPVQIGFELTDSFSQERKKKRGMSGKH